jgi:indolepyruvate ferredoxin oxidoreductase beta subunit
MASTNILIVGVGGQGTLLASKIIGGAAIETGCDVKVSEVHGMSQRGGSVVTYVRYSKESVASPIIERGEADIILAFELLEAFRSISYLKKGGRLIIAEQEIAPMPVITGAAKYPEDILSKLKEAGIDVYAIDAMSLAKKAGSEKAANVVMIGKMAAESEIGKEIWIDVIKQTVKPKFAEMNVNAFMLGYEA